MGWFSIDKSSNGIFSVTKSIKPPPLLSRSSYQTHKKITMPDILAIIAGNLRKPIQMHLS